VKTDILSMNLEELNNYMESIGEKKFRAKQVYQWLHQKQAFSYDEMTNLNKELRDKLDRETEINLLKPIKILKSKEDGTQKYLYLLNDGLVIEAVLMRYKHGNSVCISTQVGCRMGCKFCASTLDGLERNLTPSEMLSEIYHIIKETGERVSNIVLMGSGEPLDNFDNVIKFIDLVTNESGINISARNITLSTCGIVPGIIKLADLKLQITLAISLHAYDDEKRKELMPIANKYKISEILEACKYYFEKTGRRISFEYSLVAGVNDFTEGAVSLAKLLKGYNCHVNLIPVNPIKERDFKQTGKIQIEKFKNQLEKYGINVTIRREMGADIQGACGQLRKSFKDEISDIQRNSQDEEGEHEGIW